MANCPHCARKLRLFDWRPQCPGCGVNLMFYGFEKRFYEDAKLSELSMAAARARLKRFKASFNGSLPAKLRAFTCFLPLAALLLPMGVLRADMPFAEKQWSAGLLGLLGMVMRGFGELPWLRLMLGSEQAVLFRPGLALLAAAALTLVLGLLVLVCSLFCFLSMKHMPLVAGILSVLGALFSAGGFAAGLLLQRSADSIFFSGGLGYGAPLAFVLFCWTASLNFLIHKRGIPVAYEEGEFERAQIFKKVKAGGITPGELPFPVVETEKTRELEALVQEDLRGGKHERK